MTLRNPTAELLALENRINQAIGVAAARGFTLPAEYAEARAVASAANRIATTAVTAPTPVPTDPDAVADWVTATAAAAALAPHVQAAAEVASDAATRRAMRAAVECIPTWIAEVCNSFAPAADKLQELLASAPREITARSTPAEAKLHTELLAAVEEITSLALARGSLAIAAGEDEQIGTEGVFVVMDPRPDASLQAVAEVVKLVGAGIPTDLATWERVAQLGIGIARQGQVGARSAQFARLQYASGMAPDGGMIDKTYREAARLLGEAPAVAAISA